METFWAKKDGKYGSQVLFMSRHFELNLLGRVFDQFGTFSFENLERLISGFWAPFYYEVPIFKMSEDEMLVHIQRP
jgi:hypothetical protein